MTVGRIRSVLYAVARTLGDYNAARRGRIGQRIAWRVLGRFTNRLLRAIIR